MNRIVPITLREARAFVDQVHRHHAAPQGGIFAIGLANEDGYVVGVVIVGRPVSRMLDDGFTAEITRLAVNEGNRNACSRLYRAACRTSAGMGYQRMVTYTLASESGASLKGAGFKCVGIAGGGSWSRESRPRVDLHPTQDKIRWEVAL